MARSFTALFLVFFAGTAIAESQTDMEFRSTVSTDTGTFIFDVSRHVATTGHHISVRCIEDCKRLYDYQETTMDAPVYVMPLRDGTDRVVTLWTTGSAYSVVVYYLSPGGVEKVLTIGSRSPPDISFDKDGQETIKIRMANGLDTYTWSNGAYSKERR